MKEKVSKIQKLADRDQMRFLDRQNKEEEINYQKAVAIDPDKLDEEIFSQPGLYMKFSEIYSETERRREKLKNKLGILEADLDFKIRSKPEMFELKSLKSMTESLVKNTIQRQEEVQSLNERIIQANYDLNRVKFAITSLEHKKKMLEKAVDLYNGQYFSPIKALHTIKGGKRIYYENINRQMREGLNKK